ncbi:LAME_0E10022g1_1 [Lachancea meyersii CBS 8951]|uniref:LAME_0E10022g1_1 n=1 Tax=Lachancea meyersii CBS 8951 TaxID=1266667 RepID=A0A1G4JJS5_9SACH|nr:LAME_0E10022g1_1 [Lachancea meyersii CBS 8951]
MPTTGLYSQLHTDEDYKLLVLNSELLAALEAGSKLEFKASSPEDSVVLCSKNKTWLLRQKNHSNTALVMREFIPEDVSDSGIRLPPGVEEPSMYHLAYTKQSKELEARLTKGDIDISMLPIYTGDYQDFKETLQRSNAVRWTLKALQKYSPCSDEEFARKWPIVGGCVVDDVACILSQDFISRVLHILLMSCMAESLDFEALDMSQVFAAVNKDMGEGEEFNPFTLDVVRTVVGKFSKVTDEGKYAIQRKAVSQWYGVEALKKYASRVMISQEEFMIKWKSSFPPYFTCDLDFAALRGCFYRPLGRSIQYFSKQTLPDDPKERFAYLFKLQSSWELEEMIPYIEQLNTKGVKIDNFVMKYARRKRQGKRTLVSAR